MKLIIREYLRSLRERGELDVILPDLLSKIGLNVYSRPQVGTRQSGVDLAAFGSIYSGEGSVYLFAIKAGDLTRREWDGSTVQSLRPSLNEILDAYIPNKIPPEYRDKQIVICICVGGDILETVRAEVVGFQRKATTDKIRFEEWNGDKLADLIIANFLGEDVFQGESKALLRKALALIDEPEASFAHFRELIHRLHSQSGGDQLNAIRQMSICLWILFSWSRTGNNTESAYRAGEVSLLYAWDLVRSTIGDNSAVSRHMESAFASVFQAYVLICRDYLDRNVIPHVGIMHGVSSAVHASTSLDVNLRLFDILGRLSLDGLWTYMLWSRMDSKSDEAERIKAALAETASAITELVSNNPILLLPVKDDQAIDVALALLVLSLYGGDLRSISGWLREMVDRARFTYEANLSYPCTLRSYGELLLHPERDSAEYKTRVTCSSVLYPMIALWASLVGDHKLCGLVAEFKVKTIPHCDFQLWYPDEKSEAAFYTNADLHGAILTDVRVDQSPEEIIRTAFAESDRAPVFDELTAVKHGWWPLIAVACRHYRLPVPLDMWKGLRSEQESTPRVTGESSPTEGPAPSTASGTAPPE